MGRKALLHNSSKVISSK
jgi:hypothetical protein